MMINTARSTGRRRPASWFLSLLLIVALTACDGLSSVTNHHITCRSSGDAGRCDGGYGTLRGALPETIESGLGGDAIEVRAEVSVEEGRVNVSVESPDGDITQAEAAPGNPAVLQGLAEVEGVDRAFDVTFEAIDESASGIAYTIEYRAPSAAVSQSEAGDKPYDASSPQPSTDEGSAGTATASAPVRVGSLVDLLALAPTDDSCFNVSLADFEAIRAAVDAPAPAPTASDTELTEHVQRMSPAFFAGLSAFADLEGDRAVLLPLARSSASVRNDDFRTGLSEMFVGDFASDAFGPPSPDEVLEGVDTVPLAPPYGMSEGTERLTVSNGTVIIASQPYAMDAALNAQRGRRTLADVPLAVDMVAMLDDLDVVTAQVLRLDLSHMVDGEAIGLAANPDDPESWLLTVLYHPRDPEGLDALTTTLREKADAFAAENDADVVDVAARNGFAVATIRTAGPVNGASVQLTLSPSEWDERYSGPASPC